jgi:hypothetical protein
MKYQAIENSRSTSLERSQYRPDVVCSRQWAKKLIRTLRRLVEQQAQQEETPAVLRLPQESGDRR